MTESSRDKKRRGEGAQFYTVSISHHQFFGHRVIITHRIDSKRVMIARENIPNHSIMIEEGYLVPCRKNDHGISEVARALGRFISESRKK